MDQLYDEYVGIHLKSKKFIDSLATGAVFYKTNMRKNSMKKIAIDAMGGDNAPQALVEGANQALRDFSDIEIVLYGDEAKIKPLLTATERVSIVHTDEKIDSDDEPTKAIRKKKQASMVLAAQGSQGWRSRCGPVCW